MKEIYLAGGSFWALQKYLDIIFGVIKTEVGYINGFTNETSYLKLDYTSHAEAVKVIYNPKVVSLNNLLKDYFLVVDPTSVNKQGTDIGRKYRTGIYYTDSNDVPIIIKELEELQKNYSNRIVIEVEKIKNYIKAENYHQNFLKNNPFGYSSIDRSKYENLKIKQFDNLSYRVMKYKETEMPFQNEYYDNYEPGIYIEKETNRPLFLSNDKYKCKAGWPIFYKTCFPGEFDYRINTKKLNIKIEVLSKVGKNHLGYILYNRYKNKLYCINSAALRFIHKKDMVKEGYGSFLKYVK